MCEPQQACSKPGVFGFLASPQPTGRQLIGIFGGTFDPVHFGHLRVALDVMEQLQLEQLRFIPLHQAVHRKQPVATAAQRLRMLQAAIADQPGFVADDREIRQDAPSYSLYTLQSLRRELGQQASQRGSGTTPPVRSERTPR